MLTEVCSWEDEDGVPGRGQLSKKDESETL